MNRLLLFPIVAGALVVSPAVLFSIELPSRPQKPPSSLIALEDWPISESAQRGRVVYNDNCAGCHGPEGRGDGEAAELLSPKPRNFQKGYFKFRTTQSGSLPLDSDLMRTITCGLPGSSMPGFPLLPEARRRDVVAWVLHLATYGRGLVEAQFLLDDGKSREDVRAQIPELHRSVEEDLLAGRKRLAIPVAVPATPTSIARGQEVYERSCASCHGTGGRGDGSSSYWLRDWKDSEIRPRDFTSGVFRAGDDPVDLFLRMRSGLAGTPMPASGDPDEQIWAIVHYIGTLRDPSSIPLTRRMGCEHEGGYR